MKTSLDLKISHVEAFYNGNTNSCAVQLKSFKSIFYKDDKKGHILLGSHSFEKIDRVLSDTCTP